MNKNKNLEQRFRAQEIRAHEEGRVIEGYAALFDSVGTPNPYFTESIDRNAFDGCDTSECICCFNHDRSKIVARTSANNLHLEIDDKGLRFRAEVPNTQAGNDLLENIRVGNIQGCSFSFTATEDKWDWRGGKEPDHRTILKIDHLYDVSPVTDPAYQDTSVAQRSIDQHVADEEVAKKAEKIKIADEERQRKLIEISLNQ